MNREALHIITIEEWLKKGTELFGKNKLKWKFICPSCKNVQSAELFIENGIDEKTARQIVYQECIGRRVKGMGCKWLAYGFIYSDYMVRDEKNNHEFFVMEFAE